MAIRCGKCGSDNPDWAASCKKCGRAFYFPEQGSGKPPKMMIKSTCPKCGFNRAEKDSFCPNCGHQYS